MIKIIASWRSSIDNVSMLKKRTFTFSVFNYSRICNHVWNGSETNKQQSIIWTTDSLVYWRMSKMKSYRFSVGFKGKMDKFVTRPPFLQYITENKRSSIWQLCRHWWHRKLSLWQLAVPPITTKLSTWRSLCFQCNAARGICSCLAFLKHNKPCSYFMGYILYNNKWYKTVKQYTFALQMVVHIYTHLTPSRYHAIAVPIEWCPYGRHAVLFTNISGVPFTNMVWI